MFRDKEYAERPNKTQLKIETKHHYDLGRQLVALSTAKLDHIPLSEHFRHAIISAKKFQRGALKRQLKYITSLMLEEDVAAIETTLKQQNLPDQQKVAIFHQIEQWRDELIAGDKTVLNQLIQQFPNIERQYINQLIRNAVREKKLNKTPKSARLLFHYLQELVENNSV